MAFKGFNAGEVNECLARIKNSYDEINNKLVRETQSVLLNELGGEVYSEEFVKYATDSLIPELNGLVDTVFKNFQSVIASVTSAGRAWADNTGSTDTISSVDIDGSGRVNADCFQAKNAANQRGSDEEAALQTIGCYNALVTDINDALNKAKDVVRDSGFIGGSSETNLISTLTGIGSFIARKNQEVSESAIANVKAVNSKYGELESDVANAFAGGE